MEESAKNLMRSQVLEAYSFLRKNNMSVPSVIIEFMREAALEKIERM